MVNKHQRWRRRNQKRRKAKLYFYPVSTTFRL